MNRKLGILGLTLLAGIGSISITGCQSDENNQQTVTEVPDFKQECEVVLGGKTDMIDVKTGDSILLNARYATNSETERDKPVRYHIQLKTADTGFNFKQAKDHTVYDLYDKSGKVITEARVDEGQLSWNIERGNAQDYDKVHGKALSKSANDADGELNVNLKIDSKDGVLPKECTLSILVEVKGEGNEWYTCGEYGNISLLTGNNQ